MLSYFLAGRHGRFIESACAHEIVGRIHELRIDAFGQQAANLLLGEIDCRPGVGKRPQFLGVAWNFVQNGYNCRTAIFRCLPDDVKGFVLGHAPLYSDTKVPRKLTRASI